MSENKLSVVEEINQTITQELSKESVQRALLATTFKGLDILNMRKAMLEGMLKGFTFTDFLKKDVYAIPYGTGYSLVTSIDSSRKLAMQTGQYCGKTAPIFEMDSDKIISCTITVKKNTGGIVGDFTATVYFSEYTTKKNLWLTKPRTMISKVAEMHALRMAFPEIMAKQYVEEEMELVEDTRVVDIREKLDVGELNMGNFLTKETEHDKNKTNENNEERTIQLDENKEDTGEDNKGFTESL